MPRKRRFHIAGMPVHVVQRGNNRDPIFFHDADYHLYLKWLKEASTKYHCKIHAYVLMTRYYVPYINRVYGRTGTLWEGRYKSSLIDSVGYFLTCSRYIELNPVRATMVSHPSEYTWSSYAANAEGKPNPIVEPHALYISLAATDKERQSTYRELFKAHIAAAELTAIRASWQTGTPLGDSRFREEIEGMLGQKVGQARRGRPTKGL